MAERDNGQARITDHMANERTYLAWLRTGITVIALGFVVAKFGLIVRELRWIDPVRNLIPLFLNNWDCPSNNRRLPLPLRTQEVHQKPGQDKDWQLRAECRH